MSGLHGRRIVLHTCCGRYARIHCLATIIQEVQPQDHGASHSPCRGSHAPAEGQRVEARGGGVGQVGGARQGTEEVLWREFLRYCPGWYRNGHDAGVNPRLRVLQFGIAVEYGVVLAKIRAFVSNKVAMADGPTPMDVDKVSVDYAKVQTEFSEDDQEIDVINMSIQCHGCGGWGHYKSKCPTAWAVMQEQHQVVSNGINSPLKGGKNSAKGIGGFGKGGKGGKGKGVFPGKCFKCGEVGHRKQDCTKVGAIDDDIPFSDAPTYHVESVWDVGNVDVDGGWQVKMKKVSHAWCPPGLTRTAFCPGQGNRVAAARARHCRKRKSPPKAKTARAWYVGWTTRSSHARHSSSSARPMCGNLWRLPSELPRLATASG